MWLLPAVSQHGGVAASRWSLRVYCAPWFVCRVVSGDDTDADARVHGDRRLREDSQYDLFVRFVVVVSCVPFGFFSAFMGTKHMCNRQNVHHVSFSMTNRLCAFTFEAREKQKPSSQHTNGHATNQHSTPMGENARAAVRTILTLAQRISRVVSRKSSVPGAGLLHPSVLEQGSAVENRRPPSLRSACPPPPTSTTIFIKPAKRT